MTSLTVLVLGASGLVGTRVCELWSERYRLLLPSHAELDVLDAQALTDFMQAARADVVVNLAAWADVDGAEREAGDTRGRVHRLNVDYPRRLAELCARLDTHLVHISTDYVFDGTRADTPYAETDSPNPLAWYAETKLLGEQAIQATAPVACIARIEMPFTARDVRKRDLARTIAARLGSGQPVQGVVDQRITPVFLDDAASALGCLVDARYAGTVHVAAADWTTPFDLACSIATRLGLPRELIQPVSFKQFASTRPARRPQHSWLGVSHFEDAFGNRILRKVEEQLETWTTQWLVP